MVGRPLLLLEVDCQRGRARRLSGNTSEGLAALAADPWVLVVNTDDMRRALASSLSSDTSAAPTS